MTLSSERRIRAQKLSDLANLEARVRELFRTTPELSTTSIGSRLGLETTSLRDLYQVLSKLSAEGIIERTSLSGGVWMSKGPVVGPSVDSVDPRIPRNVIFLDYNNVLSGLVHCYKHKIQACLVGPQGTGKTQAVRRLAELVHAPLFSTNFSLRTREHHFLGRLDPQPDGTVVFKKGVLPLSMEEGGIYYIDEVNTAEPDSLLRLDEALDDRHEVNIEGFCVKAKPDWYCIASINPLDHAGTKELPPQIISRFPARFMFTYPDLDNELEIVRAHVPNLKGTTLSGMRSLVEAIQQLRVQSLPYTPSLRESIALGKLMASGASQKNAVSWTLVNVYFQYGQSVVDKVKELLTSRGIEVA